MLKVVAKVGIEPTSLARWQASSVRPLGGGEEGNRTLDLRIASAVLYQRELQPHEILG